MSGHQRTTLVVAIAVAPVVGACGTATTTTSGAGSATTPIATSTSTSMATPTASPTTGTMQILVNGMLQQSVAPEFGLYLVDSDGTNLRRLDAEGSLDTSPSWSPDGTQIAFERLLSVPEGDASPDAVVSVMNVDGYNLHDVGEVGYLLGTPSWSPDGSRLTFMGMTQAEPGPSLGAYIYVVDADGSDLHSIVGQGEVMWPGWSPDGSTISYLTLVSTPGAPSNMPSYQMTINAVDSHGINPRTLTSTDQFTFAYFAAWSSDGTQIAFQGTTRSQTGGMSNGLYVMNADGSNVRKVVQGMSETSSDMAGAPSWSPDGREIPYVVMPMNAEQPDASPTERSGEPAVMQGELRIAAIDGSGQRTLISPLFVEPAFDPFDTVSNVAPDWRPVTP